MTIEIKKRKNPWHTRRINIKFKEINDIISKDINVIKLKENLDFEFEKLQKARDSFDLTSKELNNLTNTKVPVNIMEQLPIESLKDFFDIEKFGKPTKPRFTDLSNLTTKLIKETAKKTDDLIEIEEKVKIAKIDKLQAEIDVLLKVMDKND